MFAIGDKVSALDEDVNGTITGIKDSEIIVETTDGFTMSFPSNKLIKVQNTSILNNGIRSFNITEVSKQKEIPKPRSFVKEKVKGEIPPPEFDLHIEKLAKNFRSMSNYDILTLQSDTAKRHIEFAIRQRIPKIVFIHGVGEGVLKSELDFLLGRYDNISFRDANYQRYGLGATEVTIRQSSK
ncbi:MAG TPA: Smr/MutS family protein [Flavobacterium sp.]|jgi:dsDNA-specific endonuclease/ATPase MutS2